MGRASPAITSFAAGEWSPQMEGRVDAEKYPVACHIGINVIALKQGPAMSRPGSAYVSQVKNSINRTWLVRFEFSQTQAFQIEFGDHYVRFYTLHGVLLSTGNPAYSSSSAYVVGNQVVQGGVTYYCTAATTGNPPTNTAYWYPMAAFQGSPTTAIYEIPSPYAAVDLTDSLGEFALQVQQSGDVLYIAGGGAGAGPQGNGYPPYTLTRYANTPPNWQFLQYQPTDGPFANPPPLIPGQEIAVYASGTQGTVTITAVGGNLFAPTDVGRLMRIQSQVFNVIPWTGLPNSVGWTAGQRCTNNGNNYIALNTAIAGGSPPVHTQGSVLDGAQGNVRWLYTDSGYGVVTIKQYLSPTQVTATVNPNKNLPVNVVGFQVPITNITNAAQGVVSAGGTFSIGDPLFIAGVQGMIQINQIPYTVSANSSGSVTLAGIDTTSFGAYSGGGVIAQNATTEWELGAWGFTTEWPAACAFYKDRLFWGGKLNVWGSVPGQYLSHTPDFFGQVTTDSAINKLVSGSDASKICWMLEGLILLIGTEGGEYGLDAANFSTAPLGPANVEILRQSKWRSRHIPAQMIGTSAVYVQRAGRKILAADYNFYLNRYDSTDQNKFAYHITIGGLIQTAYQQEPFSILWGIRADGTLLSYTFNREDQVTAWDRHSIGGGGIVESISVSPAPDGLRDELWMIVNRTVNGQVVRTVEYLQKHYEGPQAGYAGDAQASCWYVDCGLQAILPQPFSITGIATAFSLKNGPFTTYQCANNFKVGQLVFVSGVQSTGTFNANVQGVPIFAVDGASFTIAQGPTPINNGSFQYIAGGTASVGGPASQQITGIPSVLWNQTVSVLADGAPLPPQTVSSNGTLLLPGTYNIVTLGFGYTASVVPMRPEGGADTGTAQGKKKNGANLVVRVVDTGVSTLQVGQLSNIANGVYTDPLGSAGVSAPTMENLVLNLPQTGLDTAPPLMSGDFPVSFPLNQISDQDHSDFYMLIQQSQPLPMTLVGLFPNYKVEEWQ